MNDLVRDLQLELALRILVGFALGGAIGLERERRAKAAGLRTHMLVAGGAAIFTVASFAVFTTEGTVRDPTRIAAQIVTGVGVLGAGAILRSGGSVSGLTTAASIWVAAAVGILAGGGAYALGVVSVVLTMITMRLPHKQLRNPRLQLDDKAIADEDDEIEFAVDDDDGNDRHGRVARRGRRAAPTGGGNRGEHGR